MARTLDVYLGRHLTGHLIQDEHGQMVFDYAEDWLSSPNAVALSHSLPLRKERYTRDECRGYFSGILPEGDSRGTVAKNLGISASNDFAMLERIGGECAGAVTFIPAGESLPERDDRYRHLTHHELADILRRLPRRPLLAGEDGVRLSLAGAQDKIAVHLSSDQIAIPLGGAPSTHILKPDNEHFAGMIFNEAFCMRLARTVGLRAAQVELGEADGVAFLLVERYDREETQSRSGGESHLERLHQEDFCQALGIVSEHKYQNEGGPSLKQCFDLVREVSSVPVIDLQFLLNGVIFNFLIGNNDAHGKNFSLLYRGETRQDLETRLAPFYDLLSTAYYPDLAKTMAMKIGGEYSSAKVYQRHFERLAEEAGLGKALVKQRVQEIAKELLLAIPQAQLEHLVTLNVGALVKERCEQTLSNF